MGPVAGLLHGGLDEADVDDLSKAKQQSNLRHLFVRGWMGNSTWRVTYIERISPLFVERLLRIVQVEMQVGRPLVDWREHSVADVEAVAFAGWEGGSDFLEENAGSCCYFHDPGSLWESDSGVEIIALATFPDV